MIRPYFRRHPWQARAVALVLLPVIPLIFVGLCWWEARADLAREMRVHWQIVTRGVDA